jgi:hypothetical protein
LSGLLSGSNLQLLGCVVAVKVDLCCGGDLVSGDLYGLVVGVELTLANVANKNTV